MITIKEIPFNSDLYQLMRKFREDILRRPLGLRLTPQDLEAEDCQIHIGALRFDKDIVGTALLKTLSPDVVKLRQVAVDASLRGTGLGRRLTEFAERIVISHGFRRIELHARKSVEGFYLALGYQPVGQEFIEVTVPTVKMIKHL